MTTFRRRAPSVDAFRWGAPAPALVPMWLGTLIEIVLPDGTLLLKPSADRQRAAPGQWIVAEPGTSIRVMDDAAFRDMYEELAQ